MTPPVLAFQFLDMMALPKHPSGIDRHFRHLENSPKYGVGHPAYAKHIMVRVRAIAATRKLSRCRLKAG